MGLKQAQGEGLQGSRIDFRFNPMEDLIPEFQRIGRRGGDQQDGIEMGGLQFLPGRALFFGKILHLAYLFKI